MKDAQRDGGQGAGPTLMGHRGTGSPSIGSGLVRRQDGDGGGDVDRHSIKRACFCEDRDKRWEG